MTVEALLNSLLVSGADSLALFDIVLAMLIPFLLSFPITWVYRLTQRSTNYSVHFIHSIFLFASLTSIITMIIGSNIARAFGLVGALSIIRFRNALKSPVDAVYIFWALAVGMACGTGFFLAAMVLVLLGTLFVLLLHYTNYGVRRYREAMIRLSLPASAAADAEGAIRSALKASTSSFEELSSSLRDGGGRTLVYNAKLKHLDDGAALQSALHKLGLADEIELLTTESPLLLG